VQLKKKLFGAKGKNSKSSIVKVNHTLFSNCRPIFLKGTQITMINFNQNKICKLFGIRIPVVQGGMVWVSGANLASAVSNAGGLGLVGAGSMKPDLLKHHLNKANALTERPFGVNIPLLYKDAETQIQVALDAGIKIFFTSAGSPKKYTKFLKSKGCTVVHVASSLILALKCQEAGVDAVVLEGFEAGGHNGREELASLVLCQQAQSKLRIPRIHAGGFFYGSSLVAALAMGADGIQMGTRFAATKESSAHENFKQKMLNSGETSTFLRLKKLVPVRLLENSFSSDVQNMEDSNASVEDLTALLGKGRAKSGMLDGDIVQGELEIGQVVSEVSSIPSVAEMLVNFELEFQRSLENICQLNS
jgi:enoyl-[acyl-carrier protein] reductase II